MTKRISALVFCVFLILGTGCRYFRAPSPSLPPSSTTQPPVVKTDQSEKNSEKEISKENKKRIKTKTQIVGEIDSLRDKLKKIEELLATKRAQGINVSQAEEIFKNSKNLLEESERLYLEANLSENYEPVLGLLQAIEDSFDKIKEEIKKAPRFREKTKPKPREFMDDRDIIFEKMGHANPTRVQTGPMFSFRFLISDPTDRLSRKCFDGRNFTLQYPPKIMIMEFNKGQEGIYQFVLMEDNQQTTQFSSQQNLSPEERDFALSVLCESQGSGFEHFKFLAAYKNAPVGTPEVYLEQLISGRFRFADQFGVSALGENAKGEAPLADLELASIVFSTKIDPLSQGQAEKLAKIYDKIKDDMLSIEELRSNIRAARAAGELTQEAYWQSKAEQWNASKSAKLAKAFAKIESWQKSFAPKKGDKKEFLNSILGDKKDRQEIETLVDNFEEILKQLAGEFGRIQKELLRFKKDYNDELIFYDDENPVMVLLLKGVGFKVEEASAKTLFKKDIPQLLVESVLFYYSSKNDDKPQAVREGRSEISNANKYIDVSKEYQRLTSFMLGWPPGKPLFKGHYQLKLTITDEIREKAIIQEIDFTVLPASLRMK